MYLDEESQTVLLEGIEAEEVVLSALGERHQVTTAVCIDGLSLQDL